MKFRRCIKDSHFRLGISVGNSQRESMNQGSSTFLPFLLEQYKNTALLLYYSERDGEKIEEPQSMDSLWLVPELPPLAI